jgi:DNA polymerase I
MKAVARMEYTGIPVDAALLEQLKENWVSIQHGFVADIDADFGVYEGRRFSQDRFRQWLDHGHINWPVRENGRPLLDKKTFKQMAARYPQVEPLRQLRQMLSQLRTLSLPVGADGYSRTMISPYRSKTGRNQPSTTKFIFGLSKWSRKLIRPLPGRALAYVDWKQQEFGIAAALSGDTAMMEAYRTGDPYLAFAKQASAVPPEATKDTHAAVREQYKQCSLAVLYGMGAESLAERLGTSVANSQKLLANHHQTYRKFWQWSDAILDYANLYGELHSTFGWSMRIMSETKEPTLRNFPMQANGAEMLRHACSLLTEQGIRVCAPVHDAVLVEAPIAEIDNVVQETRRLMAEASAVVLDGFTLNTDETIITESEPFQNAQGEKIWQQFIKHLGSASSSAAIDDLPQLAVDYDYAAPSHVAAEKEVDCHE